MSYSTNPVADAERYWDAQYAESARMEALEIEAAKQITEAFESFGPVPYAQYNGSGTPKFAYMPFAEAVNDMLGYEEVDKLFMDMLKTSQCVKVKALLKAIEARYIRMRADELGGVL